MISRRALFAAGAAAVACGLGGPLSPPARATPADHLHGVIGRHSGAAPTTFAMVLPGVTVTRFIPVGREIALTFDACGGSVDRALVGALIAQRIPATLFLNARWIDAHRGLTDALVANPLFEIGNHGTTHRPLSVNGAAAYGIAGTRSVQEVVDEVWANHEKLRSIMGFAPRWFRSGTAHYDDVAARIVKDLGEIPVAFTINGDAGATATPAQIRAAFTRARPGDISLGPINHPNSGSAHGFIHSIADLRAAGFTFTTLSRRL